MGPRALQLRQLALLAGQGGPQDEAGRQEQAAVAGHAEGRQGQALQAALAAQAVQATLLVQTQLPQPRPQQPLLPHQSRCLTQLTAQPPPSSACPC